MNPVVGVGTSVVVQDRRGALLEITALDVVPGAPVDGQRPGWTSLEVLLRYRFLRQRDDLHWGSLDWRARIDGSAVGGGYPGQETPGLGAYASRRQRADQEAQRVAARRWDVRGFVFTTRNGAPLSGSNVTHELQSCLAVAGLPRLRFHDLRHAFATLQLEAGADLFEVSRALGHASIATTANVYGHVTVAMAGRTAEGMTAILGAV